MMKNKAEEILNDLIANKTDFDTSKKELIEVIKKVMPTFNLAALKAVDFDRTLIEFENWLVQTITEDPLPGSVKSIWFAITDSSKEDAPSEIQLVVKGSKQTPETKPNDWYAVDLWDAAGKSSEIKAFKTISNAIKNNPDEADMLLNFVMPAFTIILINSGFDIIKHEFIIYYPQIYVGCGFDGGKQYIVGKITEDGISNL